MTHPVRLIAKSVFCLSALCLSQAGFSQANVWVHRSVTPTTIYYEGAPTNSQATITITAWASGDSIAIGNPLDVIFLSDQGPKIQTRMPGDPPNWISPNRIEGAYNASLNFIDTFLNTTASRSALIRFSYAKNPGLVDVTYGYTNDHFFAKQQLDNFLVGGGSGNAMWAGLYKAVQYAGQNRRAGVSPAILMLTSGNDRNSSGGSCRINCLGASEDEAVARVLHLVDSLRTTGLNVRIFIVGVGNGVNDNDGRMSYVADSAGGQYFWTGDGLGIDSIFQDIGQRLVDVVAIRLAAGSPMIYDVLAPGIHYVPGSYAPTLGSGYITPSGFSVDTVAGLTRLKFSIDTLKLGQYFQVSYNITAAVTIPDSLTAVRVRTNNTIADNPVNYSLIQFKTVTDSVVRHTIGKTTIWVRTGISSIHLSLSPDTLRPPSPTKIIALPYTSARPAVYPERTFYAVLRSEFTGAVEYSPITAAWNFNPVAGWTAPSFLDQQSDSQRVGVTVSFDNAGLCTLSIRTYLQGQWLADYVIFSAFDSANVVERVISVVIDDDTTTPSFIDPPRLVITGNQAQLEAYSSILYGRGITNMGNIMPLTAAWSASNFSIYQSQLSAVFSGAHAARPLAFTVPAAVSAQSDSGLIRIDSGGLSFSFKLVIQDTTDYDTVNSVVVFDTTYGNNADSIAAHYADQSRQASYSFKLGDSAVFFAMMFDLSGSRVKYLGTNSAWWQLNDLPAVPGAYFGYSGEKPLQSDRLILTYTNIWGEIMRDTVFVRWGFGNMRYLTLESQPGRIGDTAAFPAQTLLVPANADTVWGVYAVIRDEYGYCVYSGSENNFTKYVTWSVNPNSVLPYVDVPSDTTSIGWIHRKSSPASETAFHLVATGINFEGLLGQADSVQVRLVTYSFDALRIYAAASASVIRDTAGLTYAADAEIPDDAVLLLTALEDTITLKAKVRRSDTQEWVALPVEWTATDFSCLRENFFYPGPSVTLTPLSELIRDTLAAYYNLGGSVLSDTADFRVELAWIKNIIIVYDTAAVIAGGSITFTILAVDQNGDTVTLASRLPSGFTLTTDNLIQFLGTDTVWLNDTTFIVLDPFINGFSTNTIMAYQAGTNNIIITITYPGRYGNVVYRDTLRVSVLPAAPDSMAVLRLRDRAPAVIDTLTAGGGTGDSMMVYLVQLYDEFKNLIPAASPLYDSVVITVSGALNTAHIVRNGSQIGYDATKLTQGGRGTVTLTYYGADGPIVYTFDLVIVPLAQVASVTTHEWVPESVQAMRNVLDSVMGIDVAALNSAFLSRGEIVYLEKLALRGYQPWRDGFLDYLDITFSMPVYLKEAFITSIRFKAVVLGNPDSVTWLTDKDGQSIALLPLDAAVNDSLHARYRLWLISNALQAREPLETGFLPLVTFDNGLIRAASVQTDFPVLVGDGLPAYTIPESAVRDSAPPVISRFLFQNNTCKSEKSANVAHIVFSEPVQCGSLPPFSGLTALTLINPGRADSVFMGSAVTEGKRVDRVMNPFEAWNFAGGADQMVTYEAVILEDSNHLFVPGITQLRFTESPLNRQIADLNGNTGCLSMNRAAPLENDGQESEYICSINGLTLVSRQDAVGFSWAPSPSGAPMPQFPFFGFSVNLQSLTQSIPLSVMRMASVTVGGRNFVVYDFDTSFVFVESRVFIYDMLGNAVATPSSHEALNASYTLGEIRRALGVEAVQNNLSGMTIPEIEEHFYVIEAVNPANPDTLRPIYPQIFTIGYEYLRDMCGPSSGAPVCVPAWNCLNTKGRMVAPGGYMVLQNMRAGTAVYEVIRKIIVTDTK